MQALLQQPAAPPGILSRLARAFQGNSFTPCLQTICYCSRRSWWVGCTPAGTTIGGGWQWVPTRPAAEPQPTRMERGRDQTKGCWTAPTRGIAGGRGRVHWRWRGNAGSWWAAHTRNTHSSHIPNLKVTLQLEAEKKIETSQIHFFLQILNFSGTAHF